MSEFDSNEVLDEEWRRNCVVAEQRLRSLAAKHGKDWDKMNDEERLDFVCEIQHADH
jgi:hypothetical protein